MTTSRIILDNGDGTVAILIPAPDYVQAEIKKGKPESVVLNELADKDSGGRRVVGIVDVARLPASRKFRNCWKPDAASGAVVDLILARAQRLAEIRADRDVMLTASDRDKARLDDVGTPADRARLATYRQALRDAPAKVQTDLAAIGSAQGLEQYVPAWPNP